jgi:hypothetical protein
MSAAIDELKQQLRDARITWDNPKIEVNAYHLRELLEKLEELEEKLDQAHSHWGMHP